MRKATQQQMIDVGRRRGRMREEMLWKLAIFPSILMFIMLTDVTAANWSLKILQSVFFVMSMIIIYNIGRFEGRHEKS